ncbi:MAG: DsrE family protein [Candidatus Hydrogenedentes bacterium]|nr:DsrE family protein [Candidatus Hydrogenedentota bacterium]
MKLGIVIYSTDAESVWNAFRLGTFALKQGDQVKVFLLANGVECETLDTEKFKVTEQMQSYVDAGGEILACGTCLKIRNSEGSEMCPLSTMEDLYNVIKHSDKVVSI